MPKRSDIKSILIIGAGPIVIGQACEFDYSGVQACKALREEGFRIILVNSNPATIMTDPNVADVTYIEPICSKAVTAIIEKEQPDAILPTMGGQTALNCALDLEKEGVLSKFSVEMLGAKRDVIDKAEDREKFRLAMEKIGLEMPRSATAKNLDEAADIQARFGFPVIIRASFALGGAGSGVAYNKEEFIDICKHCFEVSPTHEVLIDESILGWKEYELEVVRDRNDNCIVVCSIENFDAMGVHTGDSITVAPAQTLTDKEYQRMRQASFKVLREVGVETGGANVQFGLNPDNGRMVVIEMNPRVSRSSALASKATGFPIAKVAAKLAVGYTLDELQNELTAGQTPCSFEPSIDYVITKIPRFNFEKFPNSQDRLNTQMKSVGEVMGVGRNFKESMQKAVRSLEVGAHGLSAVSFENKLQLDYELHTPGPRRLWFIAQAFREGYNVDDLQALTKIDPWYLYEMHDLYQQEINLQKQGVDKLDEEHLLALKRNGFSDAFIAELLKVPLNKITTLRKQYNIKPVFKRIDTCAAEFPTETAYMYSSYDQECEAQVSARKKVVILGGGPNRIGQGIEFDYCCVHAAMASQEQGFETIMINCNPETVSTDFDVSDRLYFEPITLEDVLAIIELEQPEGVVIQYGGQTPLKLARALEKAGVKILGTTPDAIDRAEDRERFQKLLQKLQLKQPPNATARTVNEALEAAKKLVYPLVVRPSYVLGGRAMEVVYNEDELLHYLEEAVTVSDDCPILLDCFLEQALEVDVDAVCDGKDVLIGGVLEHVEQAGVHSGDSSCCYPPFSLSKDIITELGRQLSKMALELGAVGLVNAQFAIQNNNIYVLEVNPRASRTIPFISKATGKPLAKIAARCMLGVSLKEQACLKENKAKFYAVKKSVFPFNRFPGADPVLGPEMKSTGEVMGIGSSFAQAYSRCLLAVGAEFPKSGNIFISVKDQDKPGAITLAKNLIAKGYKIYATQGTATYLKKQGIACQKVNKASEGRPHIVDMIKSEEIAYIVNTTQGRRAIADSSIIRRNALINRIRCSTTIADANAAVAAISEDNQKVTSIQALLS